MSPQVSVITVVFDGAADIARTLDSVLAQRDVSFESVVIDGASRDATADIVRRYGSRIATFVSEPDRGIYDAMNKGIARARGEFVLMLNCGDVLAGDDALATALGAATTHAAQLVFGAWERLGNRARRCTPDPARGLFNHQALLYRRELHERFGDYVSAPGFTTADYLFFRTVLAAPDVTWRTVDATLARVDVSGVSSGLQTTSQRFAIDHLFGAAGRARLVGVLALHPAYHRAKRWLRGAD